MNPLPDDSRLSECFEEVLRLCALKTGETVLIFTDVHFPHPAYPRIALDAARRLGCDGYILTAGEGQTLQDRTIHAAWTGADLILGMSFLPGDYSWMYTDLHNDALTAGARVLMVQEPADVLVRLMPTKETIQRGVEGANLVHAANTMRVYADDGTDLVMRKTGRKGSYQCGYVDAPGRWDHWPSAMVYCAPLEDSAITNYRQLRQVWIRTNSSNPAFRFFVLGFALLLITIWARLRWLFCRVQGRGRPRIDETLLRLHRFVNMIRRTVEAIYGVTMMISTHCSPQSVIY